MWFKPKREYLIVEYSAPRFKSNLSGTELTESLKALASNPAFVYLLDRHKNQRLALERHLSGVRHKDLRETDFIQSGIFWSAWFEREIKKLTALPSPKPIVPDDDVLSAFNEINATLEKVGVEERPQTAE